MSEVFGAAARASGDLPLSKSRGELHPVPDFAVSGSCTPEESPCGLIFPARAWLNRASFLALEIKETRVLLRRGSWGWRAGEEGKDFGEGDGR